MDKFSYKIPYVNLGRQNKPYQKKFSVLLKNFLAEGNFILGKHVSEFEKKFSKYIGTKYAVGVGSGTDALYLSLRYLNLNKDDEVITVSNSYLSTVSTIMLAGAKPVLVDVNYNDYNIDINQLEKKITKKTKVLLPVHLCGNPADMEKIIKLGKKYNLKIIEDGAQAVGAKIGNRKVGSFGFSGCFSFHPLKNLNAIGDGGIIATSNKKFYDWLLKARNNGHPDRDHCDFWSHNMRLDALQAMFLKVKLEKIENLIKKRNNNVSLYQNFLSSKIELPYFKKENRSVHQTFIVKTKDRNKLILYLKNKGIELKVHYPIPIHKLKSFIDTNKKVKLPVTEKLSKNIVTLPAMEYLSKFEILKIIKHINNFFESQ
jgi:dTDP-4-amino-4,6-dideoxygalactose transaminase